MRWAFWPSQKNILHLKIWRSLGVKCKCIHLIWLKEKSKAAHAARIQFFLSIHCILASRQREVPKENIQYWDVETIQVVALQWNYIIFQFGIYSNLHKPKTLNFDCLLLEKHCQRNNRLKNCDSVKDHCIALYIVCMVYYIIVYGIWYAWYIIF